MKSKEEIWKAINGYEGIYEISNLGRVKSLQRGNRVEKILSGSNTRYSAVTLSKNNIQKRKTIHRLVAIHFIPNPDCKEQVNHKDGTPSNNCVDNLEWCTHQENMDHAYNTGLIPPYSDELKEIRRQARLGYKTPESTKSKIKKSLSKKIICVNTGEIFNSMKDAIADSGIPKSTFHRKLHKGELIKGKKYEFIQWYNKQKKDE